MIREATTDDIGAIIDLGGELEEQSSTIANIDPLKARKNLAFFMNSKRCLVLVAEHNEEVVGFIVGGIEELWYSQAQSVTDVAFYVRPRYRVYGPGLVKRLRAWGKQFPKVQDITLGISSGLESVQRTGQLYERLGLKPAGGIFIQKFGDDTHE